MSVLPSNPRPRIGRAAVRLPEASFENGWSSKYYPFF